MDFKNLKVFVDHLAERYVPGNAVVVYLGGEKVFSYAAGYADLEKQELMTPNHYLNIYSCSKVTTVTAAMQLLEQGKILATDPLSDYIPEYKEMYIRNERGDLVKAEKQILVRDLFTMTAGLTLSTLSQKASLCRSALLL